VEYIDKYSLETMSMQNEAHFFRELGARIRKLREEAGYSQEDMLSHGYSVRYWQRVEAGKPITLRTLLRICRLFSTPMDDVVRGLDEIPKRGLRRRQSQ
jgi:transcriptional regulator with XRE-family HTH domain